MAGTGQPGPKRRASVLVLYGGMADFTLIAALRNLEVLEIEDIPLSDLTPIAGLKGLGKLGLSGTLVTGKQIKSIKQALPNCGIGCL